MAARKKATAKKAAETKTAVVAEKAKLDRVEADAPSPSTRASNRIAGAEIESGSGPQERGAARGARRPYTERLPGARRADGAVIPVLSEEEERIAKRRGEILKERKEALEAEREEGKLVVATQMGTWGEGTAGKRIPAGSQFLLSLRKGETPPSWVEDVEEYEARIKKAQASVAVGPGGRAGRRERALSAVAAEDTRRGLPKDKDEDDVL
jgi:hypothetical protein